jgi:hypothetical protein
LRLSTGINLSTSVYPFNADAYPVVFDPIIGCALYGVRTSPLNDNGNFRFIVSRTTKPCIIRGNHCRGFGNIPIDFGNRDDKHINERKSSIEKHKGFIF